MVDFSKHDLDLLNALKEKQREARRKDKVATLADIIYILSTVDVGEDKVGRIKKVLLKSLRKEFPDRYAYPTKKYYLG